MRAATEEGLALSDPAELKLAEYPRLPARDDGPWPGYGRGALCWVANCPRLWCEEEARTWLLLDCLSTSGKPAGRHCVCDKTWHYCVVLVFIRPVQRAINVNPKLSAEGYQCKLHNKEGHQTALNSI